MDTTSIIILFICIFCFLIILCAFVKPSSAKIAKYNKQGPDESDELYNIRINDRLAFVTFSKKDYLKNDDVTYKIKRKDNKLAIYTEIEGEGAKGDVISINDVSCFYVYDDIEFIKKNDLSIEITRTLRGNDAALNKAQKEASKTKIIKKATIEFAKKTKIEPIIIVGGQVSRLMEIMPEKLL